MNRLFFRFFLLVILSITLATFLIYAAISWLFGDPLEQYAARQAAPHIFLLEQFIDQAPQDQWLQRLNKVREVSAIKLDLLPLRQAQVLLPERRKKELLAGRVVLDTPHKAFLRRVDLDGTRYVGSEDDVLYAHGLPIDDALALKTEALRFVIVALALLIPIALWSRAHWQGLQQLSRVADEIGQGNLAARAEFKQRASIWPLAQHINQMAARIASLISTQKSLLHAVSHELRTPIARLEFGMELLRDVAANPQLDARIDAMQGDLAELNALVNELLSMAKLEQAQPFQARRFAIAELLAQCLAAHQHATRDLTLTSRIAPECVSASGDTRLLTRALGNLLKNAIRYAQGQVLISVTCEPATNQARPALENAGATLLIKVEDDGPGIAPEERERIFEAFYRIDPSRDRNSGGFGLGLAIARQAARLHGGEIHAGESILGGACFSLSIPLVAAPLTA